MTTPAAGSTETVFFWNGEPSLTGDDPQQFLRAGGADLREAAKNAARMRSFDSAVRLPVLIEVHTLVDCDVQKALRQYSQVQASGRDAPAGTIHYAGTPAGLAGLVADVRSLDLADGVVLTSCTCLPLAAVARPSLGPKDSTDSVVSDPNRRKG